ncbi:MAG: hypothetical protein P4L47_23785 [Mucilaginibacter sp.]|nr:hypothetical protein [Mucilaginibacter sp.]
MQEDKGRELIDTLMETGAKAVFYKVNTADAEMVQEATAAVIK